MRLWFCNPNYNSRLINYNYIRKFYDYNPHDILKITAQNKRERNSGEDKYLNIRKNLLTGMIFSDDSYHSALDFRQNDHQQNNQITAETTHCQRNREYPALDLPLRSQRSVNPHSPTSFGDTDRSSSRISAVRRAAILRHETISKKVIVRWCKRGEKVSDDVVQQMLKNVKNV